MLPLPEPLVAKASIRAVLYLSFFKTSIDIQSPPSVKTMSSNRKGVLALGSLSTLGFARQASPPLLPYFLGISTAPVRRKLLRFIVYVAEEFGTIGPDELKKEHSFSRKERITHLTRPGGI